MLRKISLSSLIVSLFALNGCSQDSNLNRLIFSGDTDESEFAALQERAQIAYDDGDIDKAYELANDAYAMEPGHEELSILLGNISMSKAGIDFFILTKRMIAISDKKDPEENDASNCGSATSSDTNSAAGTLDSLSCILDLSDDDLKTMGLTEEAADVSVPEIFEAYPILLPQEPGYVSDTDSVRYNVNTLRYINEAIQYVCPFVDSEAEDKDGETQYLKYSDDDDRHKCEPTTMKRESAGKAHLVWALAHLVEALAFNSIILYEETDAANLVQDNDSSGGFSSNLLKRVSLLNDTKVTFDNAAEYADTLLSLKNSVDAVFKLPEGDENAGASMLQSTLINLKATVGAFTAMAGIPDSMTKSIVDAITKIEEAAKKLQGGGSNSDDPNLATQSKALQGQFTEKAAKNMEESINKFTQEQGGVDNVTTEDKEKVCGAYDAFAEGLTSDQTTRPSLCN